MKTIITVIIASILLCTACQKGGNSYVEGHIYKTGTDIPIRNVRLNLVETHNGNQGEWFPFTYSDDNGYYKIYYSTRFSKSYRYYIMLKQDSTNIDQTKKIEHTKEKFDFYFP